MLGGNTLYFGYGSNLWREQMTQRCPESEYVGVARLPKYRWIIYDRGYANVVKTGNSSDEVYALAYTLNSWDESRLDRNEGVPVAYQKDTLKVEFWESAGGKPVNVTDRHSVRTREMLVYIDYDGTHEAKPKEEYIYRMNKGIDDAIEAGVPAEYVDRVMRRFIPDKKSSEVEQQARKQALKFEDEL